LLHDAGQEAWPQKSPSCFDIQARQRAVYGVHRAEQAFALKERKRRVQTHLLQ